MRHLLSRHSLWQLAVDAVIVATSWWLAFSLRFDGKWPHVYVTLFWRTVGIVVAIKLIVFIASGFYNRWWRYVSVRDMWVALRGVVIASIVVDLVVFFAAPVHTLDAHGRLHLLRLPRSIAAIDLPDHAAFDRRFAAARADGDRASEGGVVARGKEVVVIGAGDAGRLIVQEMQRSRLLNYTPIGFIDDDPRKQHTRIMGVRVLGAIDDLAHVLRDQRPDELLIAMPTVSGDVRRRIVETAQQVKVPVEDAAGPLRAHLRRPRARRPDPSRAGRGRARPRAGEVDFTRGRVVPRGADRPRYRRGRLDRLRALPPDRADRADAAHPRRQRRGRVVRDRARARRRARLHRRGAELVDVRSRGEEARGFSRCTARRSSSTRPRTSTSR